MIKVYRKKQTRTVHLTQDVLNKYNDLCITGNFVVFGTNHYTDIKPMVITDYAKMTKKDDNLYILWHQCNYSSTPPYVRTSEFENRTVSSFRVQPFHLFVRVE